MARIVDTARFLALPFYVSLCLILGGASAPTAGVLGNALLQIIGAIIIALFCWRLIDAENRANFSQKMGADLSAFKTLSWIFIAILAWLFIQIIPLPPALWHHLPGRTFIINNEQLLGMASLWRPIAMQPNAVWASCLWLLIPVACVLLSVVADLRSRRITIIAILLITVISSMLGIVQIGQGPESAAYFYDVTNDNTSVGFFSNSNHLATLFLCAMVFSAWLFIDDSAGKRQAKILTGAGVVMALFWILNIFLNRSLAGYALLFPAIIFVISRHSFGQRLFTRLPFSAPVLIAIVAALSLIAGWVFFTYFNTIAISYSDPKLRLGYWAQSFQITKDTFPFGTGLGSFRAVFATYENAHVVDSVYANHAHNDYVELLMEGGIFTIGLGVALFLWIFRRFRAAWDADNGNDKALKLASAMVLALVAGHSLGDYPARTAAIASILAFAIGNLVAVPKPVKRTGQRSDSRGESFTY